MNNAQIKPKKSQTMAVGILFVTAIWSGVLIPDIIDKYPPLPQVAQGHRLEPLFIDEFEGNSLNPLLWTTCYDWHFPQYNGCTNSGNNEQQWYKPSHVRLGDGLLTLTATKEPTLGWNGAYEQLYPYTSGMISSGREGYNGIPKKTARYGYFEARMQLPEGRGLWPAFWLLPADRSWPPEIDIMEFLGDQKNSIRLTYHWRNEANTPTKDETIYTDANYAQGWHTFGVLWQPERIDWFVDGQMRKTLTGQQLPHKDMEIIINLAVGGRLPGDPDHTTTFPATMRVDYVRAYSLVK